MTDFEQKIPDIISKTSPCGKDGNLSNRIYFDLVRESILDEVLEDMWEYSKVSEFYKYFEFPPFTSKKETHDYLLKLIQRREENIGVYWFLRLEESDKVIGTFGLVYWDLNNKKTQIGYGISPHYWRKGYFSEALTLGVNYCFDVLGFDRVEAHTRLDNLGSIKGLEKYGFKSERLIPNSHSRFDGTNHDATVHSMTREDFSHLNRKTELV